MSQVVGFVNRLTNGLFDLLLIPFRALHPIWPILFVSLVAGVVMVWIFGKVSNQEAVHSVRDRIRGNLIGVRIFGDDLWLLVLLQARILRATATYMRHALLPMVVMFVPVLLILTQLHLWFAARPLKPGERTVITVKLREAAVDRPVTLEIPEGVDRETSAVHVPELGEISWRLRADAPGRHVVRVSSGDHTVEKQIEVGDGWAQVSMLRSSKALDLLLHPGERPIASSSPIESVHVAYPYLPILVFGFHINWLFAFFVASIAFGFAFRKPLGVEI